MIISNPGLNSGYASLILVPVVEDGTPKEVTEITKLWQKVTIMGEEEYVAPPDGQHYSTIFARLYMLGYKPFG